MKKEMKEMIAKKMKTPAVTPYQLLIFIALVIYNFVSNTYVFSGVDAVLNICATIGGYFLIMILRGKMGGDTMNIIKTLIEIIISPDEDKTKISKLENVLVVISRELGILYEKEMEKFVDYMKNNNRCLVE